MKVAVLVPWRSDNGGRRDELWSFTRKWIEKHHDVPIFEGDSESRLFDRGAAINDAARRAGDWDVALIHDADNIADPAIVEAAVDRAYREQHCVFPFECYIYLEEVSSNKLMYQDNWFVVPYKGDKGYGETVKFHHYSGVQAVPRSVWDKVGGFIELTGWGADDAIMEVLFSVFGGGVEWLWGSAFHLFHAPMWYAQPRETAANRRIYGQVLRHQSSAARLKIYLQQIGHPIP